MYFRRLVFLIVLSISMITFTTAPSYAIFGLSKCERVKKSIQKEEAIGRILWIDFDKERKDFLWSVKKESDKANANYANNILSPRRLHFPQELRAVHKKLILVLESDNRVFGIVNKDPKCFENKLVAKLRSTSKSNKDTIRAINSYMERTASWTSLDLLDNQMYDYIAKTYYRYVSIFKL